MLNRNELFSGSGIQVDRLWLYFRCLGLVAIVFTIGNLVGCSSEQKTISKAHPATYLTDIFGVDNGMPMREVQQKEFYFKKCELEARRPFPNRIEFSCNEP